MREALRYRLCGFCVEREGGAGSRFDEVPGAGCSICGGALDRVPALASMAARVVRRYQFKTFSVGVSLPDGVQEKEDEIRAALKLKGKETIKTQAARMLAERLSSRLHKRVDRTNPDLSALVAMAEGRVSVWTKPLFFYGRYSKPAGVSQRRELCPDCLGRGCEKCEASGFVGRPSVESQLRRKLKEYSGTDRITFTWVGSEDPDSRVLPPGRPFVAELKCPLKRAIPGGFGTRFRGGTITVRRGRLLPSRPMRTPTFRFRTRILCETKSPIEDERIKEVKRQLRDKLVRFDRPHGRPTFKTVYSAAAHKKRNGLLVEAVLDGGLPVKRFVSGDLVSPSVSEVLKAEVRCRGFDIREVQETGEFTFAQVSRL